MILKERHAGKVTVVGLEAPEMDDTLFTALAKGADRALKVTGVELGLSSRVAAAILSQVVSTTVGLLPADLVLVGCQAIDDLDGQLGAVLSNALKLPYVGIVSQVEVDAAGSSVKVVKEYAGGVRGEIEVSLPAVLGIQAAEKPPRYVPVAKVRAVMKSQTIESVPAPGGAEAGQVQVLQMARPEVAEHAEMLEGSPEEVEARIAEILATRGLV